MLFNFIWFQVNWFGLILFENHFLPVSFAFIVWHYVRCEDFCLQDLTLASSLAVCGLIIENMMLYFDVISFSTSLFGFATAPLWLILLWFVFGLTLNHSLRFFYRYPFYAYIAGAVFGPISYVAGIKFGAADLGSSMFILMFSYAVVWSLVFGIATRFISYRPA